ncbi:MAG: DVUA0089 family protein [Myxococcales bacterium]
MPDDGGLDLPDGSSMMDAGGLDLPDASTAVDGGPARRCGDGFIDSGEMCDDGDSEPGDGCDASCQREPGWVCDGAPSVCSTSCGDGIVAGAEKCDDQNAVATDGCASCTIQLGYACSGAPSVCVTTCGDGLTAGTEQCDDQNSDPADGCDACAGQPGWTCTGSPSTCATTCGDGVTAGTEPCDDANAVATDGCDGCVKHPGWTCTGSPSTCVTTCGDGVTAGTEQCDDANAVATDGCDGCVQLAGWTCTGVPSACVTTCGDGVRAGAEQCDDANAVATDGCDGCVQLAGWTCTGSPSICATNCGDGITAGPEECDDANSIATDGCDDCVRLAGWTCSGAPSVCATTCGDGVTAGVEECDDQNAVSFDGCNDRCQNDLFTEAEANDTTAQANGPFRPAVLIRGAVTPATDRDHFRITLPGRADLSIETFDDAPGSCKNLDTVVTLRGPDETTVVAKDDDGGPRRCASLVPERTAAMRHLPAGTYDVEVGTYGDYRLVPAYTLLVRTTALCGDGVVQGSEQCDGTPGCTADCERVPACGDGFVDGGEQCDDRNAVSGDGCSATCRFEVLAEVEPNDTPFMARASGFGLLFGGAVSPASDVDWRLFTLVTTSDLRLQTFDASGPGHCAGIDTVVTLFGADGTTAILSRDQGGVGNCGAIDPARETDAAARHLPPGTYFVRVESHANASVVPAYTLLVTLAAQCGNGVTEGAEECDGTPGCSATCDRVPLCGDGLVDAPETCDDRNAASGDGCSATCQTEAVPEAEPNDTPAQSNGPFGSHALMAGTIDPGADVDFVAVQLIAVSDLVLQVFDARGPGHCQGIDPVLTLYGPDRTTVLATRDDGGIGMCSKIDAKVDPGARHLAPGTYYVKVADFQSNTVIPGYVLEVDFAAVCGDGAVEGAEECDGSAGCDASCNRVPTCGDGLVDSPETCDDANTASGDGCSATCQLEAVTEVEPDDTPALADAAPVQLTGSGFVLGAIGPVGDRDVFALSLAQASVVRVETFDGVLGSCSIATSLAVLDAARTQLWSDDGSGIASCSALVVPLAAGKYYLQVTQRGNTGTIPAYVLQVQVLAAGGAEAEPNDTRAQASPAGAAHEVFVNGGHQANLDVDFFAVTVAEGQSIRAELVEGSGAETCESLGLDSYLTLYDASGLALGWDDDGGRGFCSLIDGTGDSPAQPFAHHLPAGTYYLAVEAAPFAQLPTDTAGQFDYRLAITVR